MAQTEKLQSIEAGQQQNNISMSNNFPKELLQRFISGNHYNHKLNGEEGEEDVELSLGLSLNGRFGVDPKAKNNTRSSSIASDFINPATENGSAFGVSNMESNYLSRTCSSPTETTEEWRKRKETQTLRRMEAKRKRTEKQKNSKTVKDETSDEEDKRENGTNGDHHQKEFRKGFNVFFGVGVEGLSAQAEAAAPPPLTHESQGTGSSGITEFESQPLQGMNKCTESRSPVSVQSLSDCEQRLITAPGLALAEKPSCPAGVAVEKNGSNKLTVAENGTKEVVRDVLEDMPYVSTKGDGPNGKHTEGFLYQYRKGEEVRIVCVCHGSFLSPAEFVKHAGGGGGGGGDGDVEQPLKHIVVHPSPFF
uniref:Ninja-family protein n=1 Tax=Salix viminalis TaxID=40686 RepID=A0A6N2NFJ2_SALVM